MPLLDAALAFSLTMLVVATIVTQLVEIVQRCAKLRRKDLQKLLTEFSTKEVVPVLDVQLARMTNKASEKAITAAKAKLGSAGTELLHELQQADGTRIHISSKELIERLKRTNAGKEFLAQFGDAAQHVFDEVAKHYEAFGDKFTAAFRERARLLGTIVAIILALVLNIDSIHLLKSYISNTTLRESVIAKLPEIDQRIAAKEKALKDANTSADQGQIKELKETIAQMKGQVTDLKASALPIGPSQYPYLPYSCDPPPSWTVFLLWAVGVSMTGALAGLGSPFWYDVVRGLAHLTQRSKDDKAS